MKEANRTLLAAPEALQWEQVRKTIVVPTVLSIDDDTLTNTMKPKSKNVRKKFKDYCDAMYAKNLRG